jgi:thiosulfate/3-mercaptopyruvate sulfurtransferase
MCVTKRSAGVVQYRPARRSRLTHRNPEVRSPKSFVTVIAVTLLMAACAESAPPTTAPVEALASSRPLAVPPVALRPQLLVSTDWLADNLDRRNVVVLHFGSLASYNAGHIPGARWVFLAPLQPAQNGVSTMLLDDEQLRAAIEAAGVSTSDHVIVSSDNITAATRGFFHSRLPGTPPRLLAGRRARGLAGRRPAGVDSAGDPDPPARW